MINEEKVLLLQSLLEDIHLSWIRDDSGNDRRIKALELANELGLKNHIARISYFSWGDDGRYFRRHYTEGGYKGMNELHGLNKTYFDKSEEFQKTALIFLTYPEYIFADFKEGDKNAQTKTTLE